MYAWIYLWINTFAILWKTKKFEWFYHFLFISKTQPVRDFVERTFLTTKKKILFRPTVSNQIQQCSDSVDQIERLARMMVRVRLKMRGFHKKPIDEQCQFQLNRVHCVHKIARKKKYHRETSHVYCRKLTVRTELLHREKPKKIHFRICDDNHSLIFWTNVSSNFAFVLEFLRQTYERSTNITKDIQISVSLRSNQPNQHSHMNTVCINAAPPLNELFILNMWANSRRVDLSGNQLNF